MNKREFLKNLVTAFIPAFLISKTNASSKEEDMREYYEMAVGEKCGENTVVKCTHCGRNGLLPYESNVKLQHTIYHMDSRDRGDYYFVDYCAFDGEGGWEPNSHMAYVHHRNSDGLKIWEAKWL